MQQMETVLILDFGGQYGQQIARRVRQAGVCSVVRSYKTPVEEIGAAGYRGIILSAGPRSLGSERFSQYDPEILNLGIPVLGIGYGAELMARLLGGQIETADGQGGQIRVQVEPGSLLYQGLDREQGCFVSHAGYIRTLPQGFTSNATSQSRCLGMEHRENQWYATQFHPEVDSTENGQQMLQNFLYRICGCSGSWNMASFVERAIQDIRAQIGDSHVVCGLSGGVDSSVAAVMVAKAVGKQLTCILVDHGLLRKNEADMVEQLFTENYDIHFIRVNAQQRFLDKLAGVTDPEQKRKIIGEEFIRVFEQEANKLGKVDFLVQGTIYPDIIESGDDESSGIKSHHNVGGLPERMDLKLCEPLRDLFKDEVRQAGLELGLPYDMVWRQPFPGPGLAVRCIGAITEQRLAILREADAIFRQEIVKAGLERQVSQYFAVITDMRSVGVKGNTRTYDYTIALRAVNTTDFMTADWTRLPLDLLATVSNRIVNEVDGVNRVVYDITGKPPATIEWE